MLLHPSNSRVLLIGDPQRQVHLALQQAAPAAQVTAVATVFDAIAELTASPAGAYSAVLAPAEPIERRPEAAVRALRSLTSGSRLLLFGHPTLEPLSRKMLEFGADDYFVTPASPAELKQMLSAPALRLAPAEPAEGEAGQSPGEPEAAAFPAHMAPLAALPIPEILLDALINQPQDAPAAAVREINARIAPALQLQYLPNRSPAPAAPEGAAVLSHPVRPSTLTSDESDEMSVLHLVLPRDEEESAARHFLAQLAHLLGKIAGLQDRHNRLQKLAVTDDLTGVYNARFFRHFLSSIIERARVKLFPVTLLLIDIDNFKHDNDQYGHAVGDEILKQTASLIKRCCREHDRVARVGGDEFAVVFWEKEGPRQPKEPLAVPPGRTPQEPQQILARFRRMIETQEFKGLGPTGRGTLTISGGLAVFPFHGRDADELLKAADEELVFRAKRSGNNSIFLVGSGEVPFPSEGPQ